MKKKAILFSLLALLPLGASAQWAQIQHDDQKEKQWKSMENGPWDFAPDWYYWLMHNSYSGASLHWRWRGFHSGLYVEFDENDSNVKRIMPTRVISEETQRQKVKKVEDERQYIEELHKEEVLRQADRSVDLVYGSFKDDFNRMQNSISEGLLFCMTRSKGKMKPQVDELAMESFPEAAILGDTVGYARILGLLLALCVGSYECWMMMLGRRAMDVMKLARIIALSMCITSSSWICSELQVPGKALEATTKAMAKAKNKEVAAMERKVFF